ncbi:GGDEF domain-containing protein [Pseudoalteromonas sp. G4]|uniref:GGDEF domain-containing protein n=1 Tax=Pseudoalteromonas sp. G4 TaxID=2992761 RepID=UPI00237E82DE|nr:diguanylate cyclase [Pseudoalteromonas sp. G4]MDE3272600.1 GGDEF domain-containing protein [Pseudoalteromonas sp. G4]
MKYHDSMAQAQQKMTEVCWFLERYNLPPIPINYHTVYSYISKSNDALCEELEGLLAADEKLDNFILENLFNRYLSEQDSSQKELIQGVSKTLDTMDTSIDKSSDTVNKYIATLDSSLIAIDDADINEAKQLIADLINASYELKGSQQHVHESLLQARQELKICQQQLQKIEKQRHVDPLTGLYKETYMADKAAVWVEQGKSICAIAIDIDDFNDFNEKYGQAVGDVVIGKVAKKIRSYVQESGLPVRTKGKEFIILLPDVSLQTAKEIAERMRSGVEKLKFISSRSGRRLPTLTISLGISEMHDNNLNQLTAAARHSVARAKLQGKNNVFFDPA